MSPVPDLTGRLWLNSAADPTSYLSLPLLWGSGMSWPTSAENRRYAGGAVRVTGTSTNVPRWSPTIGRVTSAQALSLAQRSGLVHIARDPIGQRILCVWTGVDITWLGPARGAPVSAEVTLVLERTDLVEAV